jgi:molecular chaperone HscB
MSNPFETLGLQPTFALEASTLEERQRELNRAVHPDRHAGKSPGERRQALSLAMDVNLAYRTLRDPATRAEALLELLGVAALGEREKTLSDPLLLSDMLEQRELLEEARQSKDAARLRELGAQMKDREQRVLSELERAFAPLFAAPLAADARSAQIDGARRLLSELRYVRRFAEEVAAFEDEL